MKNLTAFLRQCIAEVIVEPLPQPTRKMKGLRSLVKHCVAEVIVEPGMTAERLRERVKKVLNKRVHIVGNPKKFDMSALIKECTLEVLKERITEAFDPTSQGPNIPEENPYPAWNAKMAKLEEEGGIADHPEPPDDSPEGMERRKLRMTALARKWLEALSKSTTEPEFEKLVRDLIAWVEKELERRKRGGPPQNPPENLREAIDSWERYSKGYKQGKADREAKRPKKKGLKSVESVGYHDGYSGEKSSTPETVRKTIRETSQKYEEIKTFREIKDREDPKGLNHNLTLECVHCGTKQTCRCSKPKKVFKGVCESCAKTKIQSTEDLKVEWKCPHCKKTAGIILEVESPADYVAFADCDHCGKEISDPKMDKAIYEVVMSHYKITH